MSSLTNFALTANTFSMSSNSFGNLQELVLKVDLIEVTEGFFGRAIEVLTDLTLDNNRITIFNNSIL